MTTDFIKQPGVAAIAALMLVACGGGIGPIAGISGTGITTSGTITGFGSIFVNGVEFDTRDAAIIVNEEPATEDDLRVGQVVTVAGTLQDETSATAETIVFDRLLDGPIETKFIDRAQDTIITALDQTVRVDESTVFAGATLRGLEVMDLIAVSGFVDESGDIVATLVQLGDEKFVYGTPTDLEGMVTRFSATTFNIGNLTVDYGNARLLETAGSLGNGAMVEVFGTQSQRGSVFIASSVKVLELTLGSTGERVELEGIVAGFGGSDDFTISGQPVDASSAIQQDTTGLVLGSGVRVEVEGQINENGVLIAQSFSIRPSSNVRLAATVGRVDTAHQLLEVLGQPIKVNSATLYQDAGAANDHSLRLDNLRFSDYVEVRASRDVRGNLVAHSVVRTQFNARAELRAQVVAHGCEAGATVLPIAGFNVRLDVATTTGRDGAETDAASFCDSFRNGDVIKAVGTENAGELMATTVGFAD